MAQPPDVTISVEPKGERADPPAPFLFVVLEGARPLAGSARFALRDIDAVTIGRGSQRAATVTSDGVRKILALTIPDPQLSTKHALLERELGRWILSDVGSKNGTRVDGEAIARTPLREGAAIEVGHTILVLERRVGASDLDSASLPAAPRGLATIDPELAAELDKLRTIAASTVPVLIGGETGTGKELIARAVHALSRRTGPLVAVNCGALAATLVESELFGVRRGAYSGAHEDRPGVIREADRGTLFLDEIGELAAPAQAALLRVLQEREVVPVGDTRAIAVDFRLVSATLHDLDERVAAGAFRADLYARIAGFCIELPPLRERRMDLGLVITELLRRLAPDRTPRFALDAVRAVVRYDWPNNIRELERCLETALALAGDAPIDVAHLPEAVRAPASTPAALTDEQRAMRDDLIALLEQYDGNISAVARHLGKARMQVQRWIARFAIDPARYR